MSRALALVIYLVFTCTCWPEVEVNKHLHYNWSPMQPCVTATLVSNVIHVKCCHRINNDLHIFVKRVCIHCNNVIIHVKLKR